MEGLEFDFVIVGGGGSGAVLARRLAELTDATVALVEIGPTDEGREEVLDFRRYREIPAGPLGARIPIVPPEKGNGRFGYPVSRVLGGSTSQNTCIWFRPPASDFDDWAAAGARGWCPDAVMPHFDALEAAIAVETEAAELDSHRVLLEAAHETGFGQVDFRTPFRDGIGRYRMSKRGFRRQSSSVVFLRGALPANLALLTETTASRLLFDDDGGVRGVDTSRGPIRARREVVLCAGALETPKLLMLSGIGPAADLRSLGIAVRRDIAGVGRHLLDHPAACVNFAARRPL
ncbi:MAG: GMC family oxidoreductase, partial [Rhizobiaceae bacterium]|nr:GMC family oxidoreductase [Rhizobiaceae bacterium]